MRIIAGKHKGRRIEIGREVGSTIRPTSDFAREAIFNILTHSSHGLNGHTFEETSVLDVFCGTGAFGLEALSRGASNVTFIDSNRDAIATAKHNTEKLHEGAVEFLLTDATKLGRARKAYDLVFLDPPYFSGLIAPTLNSLRDGGWLDREALIVAEHDVKEVLHLPAGFELVDQRRYGRAMVNLLKLSS